MAILTQETTVYRDSELLPIFDKSEFTLSAIPSYRTIPGAGVHWRVFRKRIKTGEYIQYIQYIQ